MQVDRDGLLNLLKSDSPSTFIEAMGGKNDDKFFLEKLAPIAEELLLGLDPNQHTMGYLMVLNAQRLKGVKSDRVSSFFHRVRVFVSKCNATLLDIPSFVEVITTFSNLTLDTNPMGSISTLAKAIQKIQKTEDHLTPLHCLLLRACIKSMNYAASLPFLKERIYELDKSIGKNVESVLLFFYYGGCIMIGLKKFSRAFELLRMTFTVPAQCQSAITIESYKKYICVCLLVRGEVPPPPRFGGSSALFRDLKSICTAYLDLERAFKTGKGMKEVVDRHLETFTFDQNFGLVKQVSECYRRKKVKNLTNVYISLPLTEVQETIKQEEENKTENKQKEGGKEREGEGEELIVGMIQRGEIAGGIDKKKGVVRFGEGGGGGGEEWGEVLEGEMKKTMELGRRMKEVTVGVMGSEAYFTAKMKEKQMGEFGGPSQY